MIRLPMILALEHAVCQVCPNVCARNSERSVWYFNLDQHINLRRSDRLHDGHLSVECCGPTWRCAADQSPTLYRRLLRFHGVYSSASRPGTG